MFVVEYTDAGRRLIQIGSKTPRRDAVARASLAWIRKQQEKAASDEKVKKQLALMAVHRPPRADIKVVISLVARMHGATMTEVLSDSRLPHIVCARQAAVCAASEYRPDMSSKQIGRVFGRDHTTVLHARQIRGYQPVSA